MRNLAVILLLVVILLVPIWINIISRSSLEMTTKRIIVITMLISSIVFTTLVIIKPTKDLTTLIIGDIAGIIYLLIVLFSVYKNWPH